jgi:hypothetical protein
MLSTNNKTSHLITSQVPDFVNRDHQTFIEFLEYYYKFMEKSGETLEVSKNLRHYLDIDNAVGNNEVFQKKLYDSFIKVIPETTIADKTIILKHATDFYRARGSEKSIRFLLRILFDKEADIYYPKQDILRASDGKWFIEKSIRVNKVYITSNVSNTLPIITANDAANMQFTLIGDQADRFKNYLIRGQTSNATAIVEDVDVYYEKGAIVSELKLSGISKPFAPDEFIYTYINEEGKDKLIRANIFSGIVINAALTESGNGYFEGETIRVESVNGLGSGASVVVLKTTKGGLKNILVEFSGAGFRQSDDLLITGGSGFGASGNVFKVNESETYHPNTYKFLANTIAEVSNDLIGNAFSNLAVMNVNTSNLTVYTGSIGINGNVSVVNLSFWSGNSNVWFETGDQINVNNKTVTVTFLNPSSNTIIVNPALGSNLVNESLVIYKKPNANTALVNSMYYWTFSNVGPVTAINVLTSGEGYRTLPGVSIRGNTTVRSLAILGRMNVESRGENYQAGDRIEFISARHTYGSGAVAYVESVNATGAIMNVKFGQIPGYPVGGMGYDRANLPETKIISTAGSNAVVKVTSLLGEGERLITLVDTIGSILDLRVLTGGSGYTEPPTLNLAYRSDGSRRFESDIANAFTTVVTGVYTYPGKFINDDGHISSYNFLQNKNYYQNYSYVVRLNESISKYRKVIKDLIHPVGVKVFGEYTSFNDEVSLAQQSSNAVGTLYFVSEINTNLIFNLDAANTESYSEGNNWVNIASKRKPGANIATLENGANVRHGVVYFDGVNDYANVGNTVIYPVMANNEYTVSIWFNRKVNTNLQYLVSEWTASNTDAFYVSVSNGNVSVTDSWVDIPIANVAPTNTWVFLTVVNSTTNAHIYVNDSLKISKGSPLSFTKTGPFVIGRKGANNSNYFDGKITEIMVYTHPMSNTEVERNFSFMRNRFGV